MKSRVKKENNKKLPEGQYHNNYKFMSYFSLTYHIVWRTKCSLPTINEEHERDLYAYIFGFCKEKKCKLYRINSMPEHIHMCVEIHPTISVSEFMKVLKKESSQWMKEHKEWFPLFEAWGNGYASFTYSAEDRPNIINYIRNQKEHHKKVDFRKEYEDMLIEFGFEPDKDVFFDA